ncbi:hypothetical protein GOBAR_AA18128 [Gossypium barbadense]|uniref:NHL repeat-containing protein 2 n=1 Tax=Gossypium barbadense TaxID=3634 RepID=A0A2P5XGQ9_GOSBA|nr:hypothetical protein GOBAR_AA18128 [Gossypium barbadense]
MGQKVLTTQEAEREPLRQDTNALTFRTLKWIEMIACLHYSCPSSWIRGSRLLAGGDPVFSENLFRFGDHDGIGSDVLLQHPLGVLCAKDGQIYIADSYNHKIKKLDPASKRVTTLAGTGKAGFKDGKALAAQLSEPSGIIEAENGYTLFLHITYLFNLITIYMNFITHTGILKDIFLYRGRLIIADTNNSLIRYLDLNKENAEILTLELKGVQPPTPKSKSLRRIRKRSSADTQTIVVNGGSSSEGNLYLKISLPEEYHFSKEAQSKFTVDIEPANAVSIDPLDGKLSPEGSTKLHFRRSTSSAFTGMINCKVYYCKEDEVCLYQSLLFEVPFQEEDPQAKPADIKLVYDVKPKASTNSLQLIAP